MDHGAGVHKALRIRMSDPKFGDSRELRVHT